MTNSTQPVIMMCRPRHFEVSYVINPWMQPDEWAENSVALALESSDGWEVLTRKLQELGARIDYLEPQPGLPDLVFTANAAVVMDGKALVARFRHPERQGEEPHNLAYFEAMVAQGRLSKAEMMPGGICLEGAGDCVWDEQRNLFWMGYGPRSDRSADGPVRDFFGLDVIPLELVNPRYYHMDTALVPLSGGEIMYFPGAFSAEGQAMIVERAGAGNVIAVPEEDASRLSVNAVNLGRDIVLAQASPRFEAMLVERGYALHKLPISSFSKSGGSAFCLTLRLDRTSKR
jgi:N-dimethylarginine dimethylaminohydrolase